MTLVLRQLHWEWSIMSMSSPSGLCRRNKSITNTLKQTQQVDPDLQSLTNLLTGMRYKSIQLSLFFLSCFSIFALTWRFNIPLHFSASTFSIPVIIKFLARSLIWLSILLLYDIIVYCFSDRINTSNTSIGKYSPNTDYLKYVFLPYCISSYTFEHIFTKDLHCVGNEWCSFHSGSHNRLVLLLFPIYFHIKAALLLLLTSADPSSVSPACLCPVSDIAPWTPLLGEGPRRRTAKGGKVSYI